MTDTATTFDELRDTRPRIRRDVLFTETPGGVLFHNADGGFHLTGRAAYRFAALMVPHLTGEHSLAEICTGFGPAQQAMAAELVGSLYDRGFARHAPETSAEGPSLGDEVARRFVAQIAYIDHYADNAPERFRRFRETAVAVLGGDQVARWCALSLIRNGCGRIGVSGDFPEIAAEAAAQEQEGCPVQIDTVRINRVEAGVDWETLAEYDIVVVAGAGAEARTHRLLSAGVPDGKTLIPVWTFGEYSVTGPLTTAEAPCCWSCAVLRLGGNVEATAAAELWSEVAAGTAGAPSLLDDGPLSGPVAAMSGNLIGYEIFRIATGALPAETDGQVLIQNLQSLDVVAEPVQPHPRCRRCAALSTANGQGQPVPVSLALPVTPTVETARDAEALVENLNEVSAALVRPYTGIFRSYEDEEITQIPLKISQVEVALRPGVRRKIAAFDVHHLAGARMRALYAAAETYVEHVVPLRAETGAAGPGEAVLGPAALTTGGVETTVTAWVTATSLITKEPFRVPAAAVRPFGKYNRDRLHQATSAGSGAGADPQEAAGRGLLSALAHDALMRALGGRTEVRPLAVGGDDPELVFLVRSAGNLGIETELVDLGEQRRSSAHVVLAREATADGTGRWALGAGLSQAEAACSALRDLLGQVQLAAECGAVDMGDPLVTDLAAGTIAITGPEPAAGAETTTFDAVLDRLREAGRDALYVATTPADLPAGGISTARVLLTVDGADVRR
ncbi:TOMM precursor leader peptide-binding protein [Sphaerimonospora thailandensis]|uniref:YcaO domain-containing protein n=1 Tax=Sphaerimonospora thailandensis TaxID=795644 RepID=A0A8J3W2J3_9ACTN|nr:TOMM precursor leader peptide-binding protein [Sphaerimonospora thailandensis]GIH73278.1 hypothetical protein Mth01_55310 [Sphaerimonospora thailandensis]